MKIHSKQRIKVVRPSDGFLPTAFFAASLLGRGDIALLLYVTLMAVRLCALSSATGLRIAFSRQPSMRYVQGSAAVALVLQCAGALFAWPLMRVLWPASGRLAFLAPALLLNIEHVFYEYLFAMGDGGSAALSRGITAVLTLAGLLLCASEDAVAPASPTALSLPVAAGTLSALAVAMGLGGKLRPKLNAETLRVAPKALLQSFLYPALALALYLVFKPTISGPAPFFAGLILSETCRAPFRRDPAENGPFFRAMLVALVASALVAALFLIGWISPEEGPLLDIPSACAAIALAALCAYALYGARPK